MRIKAVANGNVIHADDEAAKILIDAGIYVDAKDEPVTATLTPPVPAQNSTQPTPPPPRPLPAKRRKTR